MRLELATVALAAVALAGCDRINGNGRFSRERADRAYREAMADFTAGRLDAAVEGFGKVVAADPGNASARFQLACLLQDRKGDALGALCNFREYLMLAPGSDKDKLAHERYAICERLLAAELAKKMNLGDSAAASAEIVRLGALVTERDRRVAELEGQLATARDAVAKAETANARLRKLVKSLDDDEADVAAPSVAAIARTVAAETDETETSAVEASLDEAAKEFAAGDETETTPFKPDEKSAADDGENGAKPFSSDKGLGGFGVRPKKKDAAREERPEYYVVQEGDTLYKIANRFYGRTSAWSEIRNANKATVTTDGRVKVGQKLRLP